MNGPAFAALGPWAPLRDWFAEAVVEDAAGEGWIAVGVNEQFEWRVPIDGPSWPGHYFLLELTRTR